MEYTTSDIEKNPITKDPQMSEEAIRKFKDDIDLIKKGITNVDITLVTRGIA